MQNRFYSSSKFSNALFLTIGVFMLVLGIGAVSQAKPQAQTLETTYTPRFRTSGQSMWGPGPAIQPDDVTYPIIEGFSWNKSYRYAYPAADSSRQSVTACTLTRSRQDRANQPFSLEGGGSTSGQFSLEARFYDFTSGGVTIDYPVAVTMTQSAAFKPGETVTLTTSWAPQAQAALTTQPPSGKVNLTASYGVSSTLDVKACVQACPLGICTPKVCKSGDLTPYLPSITPTTQTIMTIDPSNPVLIDDIAGFSGTVSIPKVETVSRLAPDGRSLMAQGQHTNFVDLTADIDDWIPAPPFGFEVEIPPIPIPLVKPLASVEGNALDVTANMKISQAQTFTFKPALSITLRFSHPAEFRVLDGTGSRQTSRGSSVTYNADQQLQINVPPDLTGEFQVNPTFALPNTFNNDTVTTFVQDLSFLVLGFEAEETVFKTRVSCGPMYENSLPAYTLPRSNQLQPWRLQAMADVNASSLPVYIPVVVR